MTTQPQTQGYIVLTDTNGALGWLCHAQDLDEASSAMAEWLGKPIRSDEDVAFILPVLGFARADLEG